MDFYINMACVFFGLVLGLCTFGRGKQPKLNTSLLMLICLAGAALWPLLFLIMLLANINKLAQRCQQPYQFTISGLSKAI